MPANPFARWNAEVPCSLSGLAPPAPVPELVSRRHDPAKSTAYSPRGVVIGRLKHLPVEVSLGLTRIKLPSALPSIKPEVGRVALELNQGVLKDESLQTTRQG